MTILIFKTDKQTFARPRSEFIQNSQ